MEQNKVLLLRSLDIVTDSRVQRYETWFEYHQVPYHIVGWDREGKELTREHTSYYDLVAGYHQRAGGIKNRIKWNIFLMKYLFKSRHSYEIIHACDFDTIMPALMMKLWGKKVIFDIFDWFSDEVKTGKAVIDKPINCIEKLATKCADLTIICEQERLSQMKVIPRRFIVIPNIPQIEPVKESIGIQKLEESLHIAYVGGFYPERGIETLLEVVSHNPHITLEIAGFGEKDIEDMAKSYSKTYENIHYLGKVSYNKALEIMKNNDMIYAMYYRDNPNHIYAAPNKFYESIYLQKPIITTKGTLVGSKVEKHQTGYTIEEGYEALELLLTSLRKDGNYQKKLDALKEAQQYCQDAKESGMLAYRNFIK